MTAKVLVLSRDLESYDVWCMVYDVWALHRKWDDDNDDEIFSSYTMNGSQAG